MGDPDSADGRRRVPRTKITVPGLPAHLVSRPRLLALLDRASEAAVCTLCAPAGFGKSLLLAEWAHRRGHAGTALVGLDADDRDDRRFFSAVLDALATLPGLPGGSPVRTLDVPAEPSADPGFLAEVVDALDDLPEPAVLILDNVDALAGAGSSRALDALVRHQPARLRLVLSGRAEPPIPLARLRLADQLAEVGADDLAFTVPEARALFTMSGALVDSESLSRLVEETEGWAVALRLAAASVVRTGDLGEFVSGHDRALREYVTEEALARFEPGTRDFLRVVSVCARISPGLATALSGRSDTAALLHELSDGSMVVRETSEPGRYRMRPLLRTYLLADFGRREPERLAGQHRLAAGWFARTGDIAHALGHYARAQDSEGAAALLDGHATELFLAGEHLALRRALGVLDDGEITSNPRLALIAAALYLEAGETGTADLHLTSAEANWPSRPAPDVEVLGQLARSRRAQLDGGNDEIVRAARQVDVDLARQTDLGALAELHRATAALMSGDREGVRGWLETIGRRAEAGGQHHVAERAVTLLGELAALDGDFRSVERITRRLPGGQPVVEGAAASLLTAYRELLRAEPDNCAEAVARVARSFDEPAGHLGDNLKLIAETLGGAAQFDKGEWYDGLKTMRQVRLALADRSLVLEHTALCAVLEHRAAVLIGAGDQARDVLQWCQSRLERTGELLLMRARGQLALGRYASAAKALEPVLDGTTAPVLPWSLIEVRLAAVRIAVHLSEGSGARRLLSQALAEAERSDVWHPFVFASDEVVSLLTTMLGRLGPHESFAAGLLARRRNLAVAPIPAPLTDRERSVLRLLPTLRSIEEIADDLTVSPNTVKTHMRGIYSKLSVRKRRDAVAVAVARGLLDGEAFPPRD